MMLESAQRLGSVIGAKAQRHTAAVLVGSLWGAVTVKYFCFTSATDIAAQEAGYGVLTTWSLVFVGAVLGLQGLRSISGGGT